MNKKEKSERVLETKEDVNDFIFKTPYFAYLDILGFTRLVRNNSHETLVELYKTLVTFPVTSYNAFLEMWQKDLEDKLGERIDPTGLRLVNISDSILIWTINSKEQSLIELLFAVRLLMTTALTIGIPLRGSVVMGDIEVLEQTNSMSIVGRGLVHAYEMEKKQLWSGCMVDSGIFTFLKSFQRVVVQYEGPLRVQKLESLIVEADVPFRDKVIKGFVVNWANDLKMSEEEIRQSFSKFNKRDNENEKQNEDIEKKIVNTISFYRHVQSLKIAMEKLIPNDIQLP